MPFPRILALALASALWRQGAALCRDVNVSPFSSASIWNTAVGSSAVYTPANIFADHTPYNVFADDDYFIVTQASDPLVPWYSQGWWNSTPHCDLFPWTPFVKNLNWPANLTVTAFGNNNAAAILQPDGDTLVLTQPLYRCNESSPILSLLDSAHGLTSIRGNGTWGGHGGSSLNAIGGTLRLGELLPNSTTPPLHALKLELFAHQYYFGQPSGATWSTCYRWPALNCDGYALDCAGAGSSYCYNGSNPLLTPGALLAIPLANLSHVTSNLATAPGRMLAWTLANYGGYLVDDTYADRATICVEHMFEQLFESAWGYPFNAQQGGPGAEWMQDVFTIFRALFIVANNDANSIGGGGKPAQPIAPSPCPVTP